MEERASGLIRSTSSCVRCIATRPPIAGARQRFPLRIVLGGTGQRPLNKLSQFRDNLERQNLYRCLGLPDPPITYP
jgi:hypothetical protein